MDVIINGGTLRSDNDHEVVANVEYVLQKAGEKEWRIYVSILFSATTILSAVFQPIK